MYKPDAGRGKNLFCASPRISKPHVKEMCKQRLGIDLAPLSKC